MRLLPKMTPAQIAEAQGMARELKRLGASGKSRSECALDDVRLQGKGLLLGLRSPLALLMKLGVALKADIADCAVNVAIGRIARLRGSPREGPESAP
jgi:hypothetical protein